MVQTVNVKYAAAAALTITLASLASDTALVAGRASAAIDNSSNLYADAVIGGFITTGTTPTAGVIEVWAYGSYDGTSYGGGATGSDATLTPEGSQKGGLRLLASIATNTTSNQKYTLPSVSLAAAFGGVMPQKWGIFVVQSTAVALHATVGNHEIKYEGVTYTVT